MKPISYVRFRIHFPGVSLEFIDHKDYRLPEPIQAFIKEAEKSAVFSRPMKNKLFKGMIATFFDAEIVRDE